LTINAEILVKSGGLFMSFIRTMKRENPFVQLDKNFIGNNTMSLKATGLLTYILSKPDGWQIRMKDVQNRFTDGETSVRSAMNELMKVGYINRYRERGEDGKFGDWVYEVYERPEFNPKRENQVQVDEPKRDFPEQGNPEQENHVFSNNEFSNNEFSNNEEEEEKYIHICNLVNNNITPINDVIKTNIRAWLNKLPYDVLIEEISNCIKRSAKTWLYVENTLEDDYRNGITTVEQVKNKIDNHKKGNRKYNKKYNKKPLREEKLPEWHGKEDDDRTPNSIEFSNMDIENLLETKELFEELGQELPKELINALKEKDSNCLVAEN
jgi:DnaD/phage-associated family protein